MNDRDQMLARMSSAERRLEAHDQQLGEIHTLVREIHDLVATIRANQDPAMHKMDHEFMKILRAREERRVKLWQSVSEKVTGVVVIAVTLAIFGAIGRIVLDAVGKASGSNG